MTYPGDQGSNQDSLEPIAIIGLSIKFPQEATSAEDFWKMLVCGRSALTEVPPDRFNIDAFYHEDPNRLDTINARGGHFLKENLAAFDAPFFSLGRAEAESLDPQQRALLEGTYHALENAGLPLETVAGSKTSVFVGSMSREYDVLSSRDPGLQSRYKATGSGTALLANRLSWFYDLRGPSMSLDTACSSSLNALHLCCQSLRSRESSMGLVCGSSIILNPDTMSIPLSNMNFLSPDSRCYSFDHRANGYARGEGTAVILLKPLSHAMKDRDLIRAVIRATGANQDGRTPGITQPNSEAQETLIRQTYEAASLDPKDTHFFEAHGTGTVIGDYMEAKAIGNVFGDVRDPDSPLRIGAVKSNIGHLEGVAGLAGLVKTILVLEKGRIPPNIWFEKPSHSIDARELGISFPKQIEPWPTTGLRRASINSFGYGGANAHAVLDDAYHYLASRKLSGQHRTLTTYTAVGSPSDSVVTANESGARVFIWSSSDESGLKRLVGGFKEYLANLQDHGLQFLGDLAYTLSERRSSLPWKSFTVAKSIADLSVKLLRGLPPPIRSFGPDRNVSFLFTGQGANWAQMATELYIYPVFRDSISYSQRCLRSIGCTWNIKEELLRSDGETNVKSAAYSQPICTTIQIALVDLLAKWKVYPTSVLGHSSGEIAAAYCIDAISQETACKLAYYRGLAAARLVADKSKNGSMMVVALPESETLAFLKKIQSSLGNGHITIACVNSPCNVTISGDDKTIDDSKKEFESANVFVRKLSVDVAYHSRHMNSISSEYEASIGDCEWSNQIHLTKVPRMYSSVTGSLIAGKDLRSGKYWVRNLISKVSFSEALKNLCDNDLDGIPSTQTQIKIHEPLCLTEIGPHSVLQRSVNETLRASTSTREIHYGSTMTQKVSAQHTMCEEAGRLKCEGVKVDLLEVNDIDGSGGVAKLLHDLPQYPFNHEQKYWQESRLSKNYRFRSHSRHELLGTRVDDWNPLEARWTNTIKYTENPWVSDHKFNGSEIYPAAGMLVMAIEASRQVSNDPTAISGFEFRDVRFLRPLLVTLEPEGVETQFHLKPQDGGGLFAHSCFHLYAYIKGEWTEICHGVLMTAYRNEYSISHGPVSARGPDHWTNHLDGYTQSVDKAVLYENLNRLGFNFGPSFRSLDQVTFNYEGQAAACIQTNFWRKVLPEYQCQSHVVHPITLDAAFHLTTVACTKGGWEPMATMVPTRLRTMWVSNKLSSGHEMEVGLFSDQTFRGYRDMEFSVCGRDMSSNECLLSLEGYRGTAISNVQSLSERARSLEALSFKMDWQPDWKTLNDEDIIDICQVAAECCARATRSETEKLETTCLAFLSTSLKALQDSQTTNPREQYLDRYIEWAQSQQHQSRSDVPRSAESIEEKSILQTLDPELAAWSENDRALAWKLYRTVGENLSSILRGEVNPLELLFKDSLLESFYSGSSFSFSFTMLATYVDLLAHKNPNLKIIEIGAGTGGATSYVLSKISREGVGAIKTPRCQRYVYTDLSPAFFEAAKERFSPYGHKMSYQTLDIEKDPQSQNFGAEYDLVIAAGVLHATRDIDSTISHVRKLLKPGGKLVLFEPCNPTCLRIPFIFGLLPGWWLGDPGSSRHQSPLLTEDEWDRALKRTGFSGANIKLQDEAGYMHTFSTIIATAVEDDPSPPESLRSIIITGDYSLLKTETANAYEESRRDLGHPPRSCEVVPLRDMPSHELQDTLCIFLLELENPFLDDMSEDEFKTLKYVLRSARNVLWLTGGTNTLQSRPAFGLITGLGRSINSEYGNVKFVELAIEGCPSGIATARFIDQVYKEMLIAGDQMETEYVAKGGRLLIPRIQEHTQLNDFINTRTGVQQSKRTHLREFNERALRLIVSSPGLLDSLEFEDDLAFDEPLKSDEVEICVKAVGVNFKDVMIAMGQLPANSVGCECSGIITRVGGAAATMFQQGDRICCMLDGAYRNRARLSAFTAAKIPDAMTFEVAAAIPVVFCTVLYSLFHVAHLTAGESILIHTGAGGVGQAAIQLAKIKSANIFVTVGEEDKRRLVNEYYDIPYSHIFVGRNREFVKDIRVLLPHGIDVVLNSRTGPGRQASLECLATCGRFVELGKADIETNASLPLSHFSRNLSFTSVDLTTLPNKLVGQLLIGVMGMFIKEEVTVPKPLHVRSVSELELALRYLQTGRNVGKMVITMNDDDLIPVLPRQTPTYRFDSGATYVITGGFGGLGRSIARWMVRWGARNLLILSRSGPQEVPALKLLENLKAKGVFVASPPCDISDKTSLASVLQQYSDTLPPIKGCIQGSMVLRDGLFENLSLADFDAAIAPKVQGSWNLHELLPRNLDFYILLSSAGGVIGSRGQSNYAAGNTYQDALARFRVSRGQACFALDLGMVLGVGFAAERREVTNRLRSAGYRGIKEVEFHAALEYLCDSSHSAKSPVDAQVITGFEIPGPEVMENGTDGFYWLRKPIFSSLLAIGGGDSRTPKVRTSSERQIDYAGLLRDSNSRDEAGAIVTQALVSRISKSLDIGEKEIDVQKSMHKYGVDSLVAVEIRYWLMKDLKAELSIFDILGNTSLVALGHQIAGKSEYSGEMMQIT